jgi:octaprenyl-diphosphate synthase
VSWNPAEFEQLVADDLADVGSLADLLGRAGSMPPDRIPRLRPILVALAARAAGAGEVDPEAQHAAELLHLALGVHDVALGQRGGRRRKVARKLVRFSVGWIGGSPLTLRALELARHTSSPEILGDLVDTLRELADGDAVAARVRAGDVPTREDWREHADSHTGAVLAFSCRTGANLARADVATVSALGRYGRHVGRLCSVLEDNAALSGPQAAARLAESALVGRPSLAVIAASEADPGVSAEWRALATSPDVARADALAQRVRAAGGPQRVREVIAAEGWAARRVLAPVAPTRYRAGLDRLVVSLVREEFPVAAR